VRVSDREGQLDIDTTGVCELLWSNTHAWMSSKVLSYQLQLAPKVNTQMRKFRAAVISAADDYRVLAAAEAADEVDRAMRTLKQRTTQLQQEVSTSKEKAAAAVTRHERYLSHVKRLEEEVAAAKAHAEQAGAELQMAHRESSQVREDAFAESDERAQAAAPHHPSFAPSPVPCQPLLCPLTARFSPLARARVSSRLVAGEEAAQDAEPTDAR
jgi:hypothetical protein